MRTVQGYVGMQKAASTMSPQGQALGRIIVGPDPAHVVTREVARIIRSAAKSGLLLSVVPDPESTPETQLVMVVLNGTAAQMDAFASAMAAV